MGEKFAANPVTGTGSMTIPIATSPGRSGFGPRLGLSYDSGSGNGPFGFGWSLSIPSITRKTDKGLPRYRDAEQSDVYILSGAEDLVPVLDAGEPFKDDASVPGFTIYRYRPRIEGLFARVERWVRSIDGDTYWRSISKDNITTIYGRDSYSRIADPSDPTSRVFSWLICESYDDKGNAIVYEYKSENSEGVASLNLVNERNRTTLSRSANRYLKRIKYGNKVSRLIVPKPVDDWMFEVVFDYGEHDADAPQPGDDPAQSNSMLWPVRQDPFSRHRAGFEVRTYRLCRRVLMFHHFDELGAKDYLVRSTDFDHQTSPVATFIKSATQSGYKLSGGSYLKRSLPPIEFTYSEAKIDEQIRELDDESLKNLPEGLDGARYQWVDLDGEGLSGILTEQAEAWYYKRNLGDGVFGVQEMVARKPSLAALSAGRQQLLDLNGNGQLELVELERPMAGFYERTQDEDWEPFVAFKSLPNLAWHDPNLKFVDLTGDGHADVLISEDEAFCWYASLAQDGFGPGERIRQALDEEQGPRLVFADGTQSIYLSDMSGDGLTDLVRIRNGEVCYWPNLGYGRFGAKVTMGNAPRFDHPDIFDQKRIRLADIDGSGVVDIIYLAAEGVKLYFNQSGNGWSDVRLLSGFPAIDNLSSVQTADLLGNGTACLVWSSPLPGAARSPLRYIDLMGGQKPHLLVKTRNNLGAETEIQYASSTRFYLADKLAGRPWITKLPFPVHVVTQSTVTDKWRNTRFSSTYSYHHGYFDGIEREFRGFARVEQIDTECYLDFAEGNIGSPNITQDQLLYQPPIKSITWYHTGAAFERDRILSALRQEYFTVPGFAEHQLPEPTLTPGDLSSEEWREAVRACKGMVLRQEVFELDAGALAHGEEVPVRLFTTAYHNSDIKCLQPQGINRHAVFLVTESEAITYHYELDLRHSAPVPDPRIAHTLNLKIDEYGNVLDSLAAVYPRIGTHTDPELTEEQLTLIDQVQKDEHHLALNCTRFTEDIDDTNTYRLRVPCQTQTWEVTGIEPVGEYFTLAELREKDLSGSGTHEISYHAMPDGTQQRRLVECARTLFFADDLEAHRPFGQHGPLGLTYESYKLALTRNLITSVYGDTERIDAALSALDRQENDYPVSGYYKGDRLFAGNPITPEPLEDQYWIASGRAGFEDDAAQHFYLPERYTDPFGNVTMLAYDGNYDLHIHSSTDAVGNITRVEQFDYRVLAPREMVDINGNHTETCFNILGMVVATAMKGKGEEGDELTGFDDALANPPAADVQAFCTSSVLNPQKAREWLGHATARFVYHFGEERDSDGNLNWASRPAGTCTIQREIHFHAPGGADSPLQVALECSDGGGNVLMKKVQAESDPDSTAPDTAIAPPLRWIINGLTVLNNKGKPVMQYEPAFSDRFGCELPQANGVTPVMYYDAAGRVVRTEMPDGTFSRVEFSPWHVATYDQNDTVLEPGNTWYAAQNPLDPSQPLRIDASGNILAAPERRAAWLAARHANTPSVTHLDSLGREVIAIAHNRVKDPNGPYIFGGEKYRDDKYLTFTRLDAEGKPLWIRDARGNLVMQYITPAKADNDPGNAMPANSVPCYDIAGNLLFQHSMDGGDRWMLNDAAGKPMLAWDFNERQTGSGPVGEWRLYSTDYDALHRPVSLWLTINEDGPSMVERYEYRDARPNDANNLNGQLISHYDPSGLVRTIRRDFKGDVLEMHKILASSFDAPVIDWQDGSTTSGLESEAWAQITEYDALKRMTRQYNWHKVMPGSRVAVYEPRYNQRGLLAGEDLFIGATKTQLGYEGGQKNTAIISIAYDAKGQKLSLRLGNRTITEYSYDAKTFRLTNIRTRRPVSAGDPCSSAFLDPAVIQYLRYTYDPAGNIVLIVDAAQAVVYHSNQRIDPVNRYEYDALYRLISAEGKESRAAAGAPARIESGSWSAACPAPDPAALRNYRQTYLYDGTGNIEQMRHVAAAGNWTRHYDYAADSNRLLRTWEGAVRWEDGAATNKVAYGYDSHGSMLNLASTPEEFRLRWDHRDMIGTANLGGGWAYYQYAADKERSRKVITDSAGAKQWERIYLGGMEVYRRYLSGVAVDEIETHHLFEGKQRVLIVEDVLKHVTSRFEQRDADVGPGTRYRYQYGNHLGSACLELDEAAAVISYEEYHPYGTSAYLAGRSGAEVSLKRYRYTGMERDGETGLSYHSARYYVPWLGRWGGCDPAGIVEGTNIYAFVRNRPISRIDPEGKQSNASPADYANRFMTMNGGNSFIQGRVARDAQRCAEILRGVVVRMEAEADAQWRSQGYADDLNRRHIRPSQIADEEEHQILWDRDQQRWISTRIVQLEDHPAAAAIFNQRYSEDAHRLFQAELLGNVVSIIGTGAILGASGAISRAMQLEQRALLTESEGMNWVQTIRQRLSRNAQEANLAVFRSEIDGVRNAGWAPAGNRNPQVTPIQAPIPIPQNLPSQAIGTMHLGGGAACSTNRALDAERRILGTILSQTTPQSTGRVVIYTERTMCGQCSNFLEQFRRDRPWIDVEVIGGGPRGMQIPGAPSDNHGLSAFPYPAGD